MLQSQRRGRARRRTGRERLPGWRGDATKAGNNASSLSVVAERKADSYLSRYRDGKKPMKTATRTKLFAFFAIAALFASPALAHGDKKHVIGTLEKLNAHSLFVKSATPKY